MNARERRQQLIPVDKKCPDCGEVRLKSRQWVVVSQKKVICRKCAWRKQEWHGASRDRI